ncbi:MAG: putative serine/threonine protein kinase [Ilumatobacteraceae bacterium]|nr:putative serine/threonine protein kinase [Ilumatobacteraceae bacterium]
MSEPDAPPSGATASAAASGPTGTDRLFAGRYRLTGRRGTGVDIALFEAVDVLGDRSVAVKIVHPDICAQPGFDERFTEIIHRVASLRHPNIAQILDVGTATWNGQPVHYVVCENLTGGSLRDLRDRGRQLSPSQIVMVGLDVCRGLDVAHRAGLVHGDIRPSNLVFGDDGRLRITDLGLSELVADDLWSNPSSVTTDQARYASPEQAVGAVPGPKSDVYSLCLCLLEAVTGQLPFVGDSTVATLSNRVDKLMPVSADLGPLASVLERAGRPEPEGRFTASEFGRALVQAAERLPRPAPIALLSTGLFAEAPPAATTGDPTSPTGVLRRPASPNGATAAPPTDAAVPVVPVRPLDAASPPPIEPQLPAPSSAPADLSAVAAGVAPVVPPAPPLLFPSTGTGTTPAAPVDVVIAAQADPVPPPPQPAPPLLGQSTARRKLLAVLAIIVVAAALGGALAWFLGREQPNDVPQLTGIEEGAALNMVSEFGWTITSTTEFSDTIPARSIIRTEPAAGTSLNKGDAFLIVVSSGPEPRTLPELKGLTVDQATAALTQLGLVIEQGDPVNDDTIPAGQIVSWSVPEQAGLVAGGTVVPGTTVRVIVSTGPAPRVMPDVTNLAVSDATAQLEALSFTVVQAPDEFSDTVPIGGVVRQDPATGTTLPIGSSVTIVASKGTEFVTIPPLADLTLQQASDALTAAGLVLGQVKGDPAGVNILAESNGVSIGADAVFPRGTTIDLTFGQPPPPPTEPPPTDAPTTLPVDTAVPAP